MFAKVVSYLEQSLGERLICCFSIHLSREFFSLLGDEEQEYSLLSVRVKQQLGDEVAKVQISMRLGSSPCVVCQYGKVCH